MELEFIWVFVVLQTDGHREMISIRRLSRTTRLVHRSVNQANGIHPLLSKTINRNPLTDLQHRPTDHQPPHTVLQPHHMVRLHIPTNPIVRFTQQFQQFIRSTTVTMVHIIRQATTTDTIRLLAGKDHVRAIGCWIN